MIRLSLVYFQRMKAAKRWRTCYRISVNYIPVFSCLFVISYFAVGFLQIHLFYWFGWFVDLYDVFDGHWYNIIKTLFCRLLELFNWSWFHQGLNWFRFFISCQTVSTRVACLRKLFDGYLVSWFILYLDTRYLNQNSCIQ